MAYQSPFVPLVTSKPAHVPSDSSQIVTIPHLPELYSSEKFDVLLVNIANKVKPSAASTASHPFAAAVKETSNQTRTDNNAPAFASTESATLDAFSTLDPNVSKTEIHSLLAKSWSEDPQKTLKIIWNLRSIHDGKSAKIAFYRAFGWLYANHPRTAIENLPLLVEQVVEKKLRKKKDGEEGEETDDKAKAGTRAVSKDDDEWTDVEKPATTEAKEEKPIVPVGMTHGYYKDLLNILLLAASDQLTNPDIEFTALNVPRTDHSAKIGAARAKRRTATQKAKAKDRETIGKEATAAKTAKRVEEQQKKAAQEARDRRTKEAKTDHETVTAKLSGNPTFRALYVAVARIFAKALAADVELLQKISDPKTTQEQRDELKWPVTLAGKWAPTLFASHDRMTNISSAIALAMYSRGNMPGLTQIRLDGPVDVAETERVRSFYRRWIISPLRRHGQIPEVYMAANEWDKVSYTHVPSLSFARNKKHFFKHDEVRFTTYLQDVAMGRKTISGATLGPHELVQEAINLDTHSRNDPAQAKLNEASASVVNGQWNTMIERLREAGTLENCLAVCDVSGSMGGLSPQKKSSGTDHVQPILPAISLTLVLAQLAKPPFNNMFITFSSSPEIVTLSSDAQTKLISSVREIERANWAMNTDFNAVFIKLLLPMAVKHKLKKDEMVKRLFVFSDMQFDEARRDNYDTSGTEWETNHQQITKAFAEAGYDVPEIVYWNLAGRAAAKPITKDTPGVAMMSGFSGNLLKVFMENEEIKEENWQDVAEDKEVEIEKQKMTPEEMMNKALGKASYAGLKVVD